MLGDHYTQCALILSVFWGKVVWCGFILWLLHFFFNTSPSNRAVNRIQNFVWYCETMFLERSCIQPHFLSLEEINSIHQSELVVFVDCGTKRAFSYTESYIFCRSQQIKDSKRLFHAPEIFRLTALSCQLFASRYVKTSNCERARVCKIDYAPGRKGDVVHSSLQQFGKQSYFISSCHKHLAFPHRERASGVGRRVATSTAVNAANIERAAPLLRPSVGRHAHRKSPLFVRRGQGS